MRLATPALLARSRAAALATVVAASLPPGFAWAHPGGVDAAGCHVERRTGVRHCHPERVRAAPHRDERRHAARLPAPERAPSSPAGAPLRRVVRAVDGDTVVLDGGERVRLLGVDTPEMHDARADVRYFAKRAALFLEDLVARKDVRLEYDRERQDRYGRTLAYLYLADGRCANAEIVRQGMGYAYTRFPFKYMERFRALEREAREARRGLWAGE